MEPEAATNAAWIEVAVAVVHDGGRFLVTRRDPSAHLGGRDEFPGGRREGGETLEQCVVREVREETGLAVDVVRPLAHARHVDAQRRVHLTFFECAPNAGRELDPAAASRRGARWVTREELARLDFPPANAELVRALVQGREKT